MRHVVTNPYHGFVHQVCDWQANPSRTMSFEGVHARSYRAEIGRIVHNAKGQRAYLLSTDTWSVTTSKHQSWLRAAIPSSAKVFHVLNLDGSAHESHIDQYRNSIAEYLLKANRARVNRSWHLATVDRLLNELRDYCEFFDLPVPETNVDSIVAELEAARKEEAKRQREENARQRELAKERIAQWIAGEPVYPPRNLREAYLRVSPSDGQVVETTHGATVPLEHVLRAIPCVLRVMESGKSWTPNGSEIRLGYYQVARIDSSHIQVGCHYITRQEVERFAGLVMPMASKVVVL